jgi:replicative DNA helicase
LRDSGALENEADVVVLLYRGEYYGFEEDTRGNDTAGRADLIVAKNAFGTTATARVGFRSEIGLFTNLDDEESPDDADKGRFSTKSTVSGPVIRLGSKINESPVPFPKSNQFGEEPPF